MNTLIDLLDIDEPTEKDYGTILTEAEFKYVNSKIVPLCNVIWRKSDDSEEHTEFIQEVIDGKWNGIVVPTEMLEDSYYQEDYAKDMIKIITTNGYNAEEIYLHTAMCK